MFRQSLASALPATRRVVAVRSLHSTPAAYKTVTEKVAEVADKVNKKVGQGLASAIDSGEKATQTAKEKIGSTAEETKEGAEHAGRVAKEGAEHAGRVAGQKANQVGAGAREAKQDFEKEVKK